MTTEELQTLLDGMTERRYPIAPIGTAIIKDIAAELIAARTKLAAAERLAGAAGVVTKSMRAMLEASDVVRNLSTLGRASLMGEVDAAEVEITAWEAAK